MLLEASRPEGASTLEAATGEHGAGPANRQLLSAELLDGSLDAIAHAVGLHRFHGVVVGVCGFRPSMRTRKMVSGWLGFRITGDFAVWLRSLGFVP
jgi:hypothetical protein